MARNLQIDERVFIPRSRLGLGTDGQSTFYETTVLNVEANSILVSIPGGNTKTVASAFARRNLGLLILRIGNYDQEHTLLNPLTKSVLQFCRLLIGDDSMVVSHRLRSTQELQHFWDREHDNYTHVILIGHGSDQAVCFGVDGAQDAQQLGQLFSVENVVPKLFLSLCCRTGYASFGQAFSRHSAVEGIIAPFHSVHGAIASQFCQTFLSYNLLEGETTRVAFRHAREGVAGSSSFRLWKAGALTT